MAAAGSGKSPAGLTPLRSGTLRDMNRAPIRGWVFVGAGAFVLFAVLGWPNLTIVLISLALAAILSGVGVWIHRSLPDLERTEPRPGD